MRETTCSLETMAMDKDQLIELSILFEVPPERFTSSHLHSAIVQANQNLFGQVGSAMPVEVMKHSKVNDSNYSSVIKVSSRNAVKITAALTLMGHYNSTRCSIRTIGNSNH